MVAHLPAARNASSASTAMKGIIASFIGRYRAKKLQQNTSFTSTHSGRTAFPLT
jgi:hypothetical protein